jgi:hypothetical protein
MNDTTLEPKVQNLTAENNEIILQLREREKQGILPPILIKFDEL